MQVAKTGQNLLLNNPSAYVNYQMKLLSAYAVHDYQSINPEILKNIVTFHLKGLEDFFTVIITREREAKD